MGTVNLEDAKIELYTGDTKIITVNVKDEDGVIQDLTSATAYFVIKKNENDTTGVINLASDTYGVAITAPGTQGQIVTTINSTEVATQGVVPGEYVYFNYVVLSGGEVGTVLSGLCEVLRR